MVRIIHALIWLIPLAAGYLVGLVFTWFAPRPDGAVFGIAWWIGVVTVSTLTIYLVRPVIKGATPLAFMYQCTLVFPDHAPARYKVALKQRTSRELQRKVESGEPIADTPQEAAEAMVALLAHLNEHDRRTRGHSERVRAYSAVIADEMGLDPDSKLKLHWAALLHDAGKMSVRPEILNKNGRPSDEEWQELKRHPGAAAAYLMPLRPWLGHWLDAATQHHERWDGGGYPRGLSGQQISLSGRIVAVADAYDVMTSTRSYKAAWTADTARAELARCAGTQFDPVVVRAFLSVSTRKLDSIAGPLAWLSHWPRLAELASALGSAGSTAAGSLGTAAAAAALTVTPAIGLTYDGPVAAGAVANTQVEVAVPATPLPSDTVVTTTAPDTTVPPTTAVEPTAPATSEVTPFVPVVPVVPTTDAGSTPPTTTNSTPASTIVPAVNSVIQLQTLPSSLSDGQLSSQAGVYLAREGMSVTAASFEVSSTSPNIVSLGSPPREIAAGTQVCTYLLHADSPDPTQTYEFTFDTTETIIGFAVSTDGLNATSSWGVGGVDYVYDGIEPGDQLTISGRTIEGRLTVTGDRDQIRLFTSC